MKIPGGYLLWALLCTLGFFAACMPLVPPNNIASHEQEAFLVLVDQLNKLDLGADEDQTPLCVSVSVDGENKPVSPELLDALHRATPYNLNAEIVDGSTCHENNYGHSMTKDGKRGLRFFAAREPRPEPIWRAGWVRESLWGDGELYRIDRRGGQMIAHEVGQWNT